jgi:hypothetical protein
VFDPENIEILDKATSIFKIRLKEELHIITHKPELNSQHSAAYKRKPNKDMFKSKIKTLIIYHRAVREVVRTLLSTNLSSTLIDYLYAYIHISHSALIRE